MMRQKQTISKEQREAISRLRNETDKKWYEIAEIVDVNMHTCRTIYQKDNPNAADIRLNKRRQFLDAVNKLRQEGTSFSQIAKELKVCKSEAWKAYTLQR